MSFKPLLPPAACTPLSGWSLLAVTGNDAAAFLQAQTMNEVLALAPGHWQWNGWLSAKGRVIALFALLRVNATRLLLASQDLPATELADGLRRFVFRSKVVLDPAPAWVAAAGPACAGASGSRAAMDDQGRYFALDLSGAGGARTLWLLPTGDDALADPDDGVDAAWLSADIAHGLPRLRGAQSAAWTPQMLSLQRLAAFSLRKGCYPGQEIVARTHYLGQARRSLARLGGQGMAEGDPVDVEGHAVGTVICVSAAGDDALAVLATDTGDLLFSGERALCRRPLLDGLARP